MRHFEPEGIFPEQDVKRLLPLRVRGWSRAKLVFSCVIAICLCGVTTSPRSLFGQQAPQLQEPQKKGAAEPEKRPAVKEGKPKEIPPAQDLQLQTKPQGGLPPINLSCTWLPGMREKETVPVLLVHDWGSSRKGLLALAQHLQKELGCAVLVPDLRGHGGSTSLVGGGKKLDAKQMNKNEIPLVSEDIEACKRFLKQRHNAGELNLELLTVIACGDSTPLAATWALADWQWPPYDGIKQGQDVKLMILLSPVRKFETLSLLGSIKSPVFSDPRVDGITTVLFWDSNQDTSEKEAKAIETVLVKGFGSNPSSDDPDRWSKIRYSLKVVNNGGYGERLVNGNKSALVKQEITSFIDQKIASRAEKYPWTDRTDK
jgi:hypothetical protein